MFYKVISNHVLQIFSVVSSLEFEGTCLTEHLEHFVLQSLCWVFDLLFGCQSSYLEDIFLMSLLSGANLSVGFLISYLGVSVPVGKTFS